MAYGRQATAGNLQSSGPGFINHKFTPKMQTENNRNSSPLLEGLIRMVSPRLAFTRERYRAGLEAIENFRKWNGAGHGRRTAGWDTSAAGANAENAMGVLTVRYRSRDLVRNNPYMKRGIQAIATNTIGSGIRPTPLGLADEAGKALKKLFDDWADTTDCDYDGHCNLYGLQLMAMRAIAESGGVIVRKRIVKDKTLVLPLQLQVLEIDFLDTSRDTPISSKREGGYDIRGTHYDSSGKITGYWLYTQHPGENGGAINSVFVEKSEVLHVYNKERPGQVDGVPFAASAIVSLYDFDEYEQAQLVRQKIAACFSVFITEPDGQLPSTGGTGTTGNATQRRQREKVEPGIIEHLPQGKTVQFATPPSVSNYDEYATSILRKIAVGLGVSYEVLSGDLSNVNFSSGRMGWIEFHRLITQWQTIMLVPMLCNPIWKWFIEAAVIMGHARLGTKAKWTPPRREMIDPMKEVQGMMALVRNGFEPWSEIVTQMGGDPATVFAQIVKDFEDMKKKNIVLDCNPATDANQIKALYDTQNNDDDEKTPRQKKNEAKKQKSG